MQSPFSTGTPRPRCSPAFPPDIRILRVEPLPNAQGQQSHIRALIDISIQQHGHFDCRLAEMEPGRYTVFPGQMRRHDPINNRVWYKSNGSWPLEFQDAVDRAATDAWKAARAVGARS